jgi:hypothetical protein
MGCGPQSHRHLLHNNGHAKRERNKRKKKSDAELRAGSRIGEHAGPIVLSQHDQNPGPNQQPQQSRSGEHTALGAGCGYADAIMRPIHVFVGDHDDFGFACDALRLWGL